MSGPWFRVKASASRPISSKGGVRVFRFPNCSSSLSSTHWLSGLVTFSVASRLPQPTQGCRAQAVAHGFPWLDQYYSTVRLLAAHRLPFHISQLIGWLSPAKGGTRQGLPESRMVLSRRAVRTHLGATGWNPIAFAPIVRARPFPVLGRPVHHGLPSFDYGSAFLRKPFGFRLAADTLPSGWFRPCGLHQSTHLAIAWPVVSSFPKLCPLGLLLIGEPRPARHYSRFWISPRGRGASGTFTHLNHALSGAHYDVC